MIETRQHTRIINQHGGGRLASGSRVSAGRAAAVRIGDTTMTTRRVIALIVIDNIAHPMPLNVRWCDRYTTPTNIARYVLPLLGVRRTAVIEIAITRGCSWTGNYNGNVAQQRIADEQLAASQRNELGNIEAYHRALWATESDDTLWQ